MQRRRHRRPWVFLLLLSLFATFLPAAPRTASAAEPAALRAVSVTSSGAHTFVTRADGTVWAWGENCNGAFGNGTRVGSPTPIRVRELEGMTVQDRVGVKPDGTAWTWGASYCPNTAPMVPQQLPELTGVRSIASSGHWMAALMPDGTVWTWGRNINGQLGTGDRTSDRSTPAPIPGLADVTAVSVGQYSGLALRSDGTVWTWGFNK